jgi:hypothetical protein
MSPDMNSFMDACKYALLFMWQGLGSFSRLEWIALGGLGLIALLMPAPTHSEINAVREELTEIRKLLEGARHDR